MIAVLFALLLTTLAGCAITRLMDRELRGAAFLGAAILVGCGYAALMMFLLTVVHIPWSRAALMIVLLLPLGLLLRVGTGFSRSRPAEAGRHTFHPIDAITLLLILGHAVFATWSRMYEWDWFGIWGLKARTFFDLRGIDWHFIQTNISHPDYPLLAPLLIDLPSVLRRGWEDRWVGLVYTALCVGFSRRRCAESLAFRRGRLKF